MTDETRITSKEQQPEVVRGSGAMMLADAAVSGVVGAVAGQVTNKLMNRPQSPPPPDPPKVELPPGVDRE
ncbi:MAG TPA: hypothetical protein VH063_12010 [Gaiellaceae bacterium]|jgi:hypothetical protein|nr:hypothetical protein [Gaiellaceae bacterium]